MRASSDATISKMPTAVLTARGRLNQNNEAPYGNIYGRFPSQESCASGEIGSHSAFDRGRRQRGNLDSAQRIGEGRYQAGETPDLSNGQRSVDLSRCRLCYPGERRPRAACADATKNDQENWQVMPPVRDFHFREPAARTAEAQTLREPPSLSDELRDVQGEKMVLNMGPSHPSTHGVLRIVLELDGEIIAKAVPDVGYLHRGDEKIAENMTYARFTTTYTRIGGLARDLPQGWVQQCRKFLNEVVLNFDESEKLLTRNRIFVDRTKDIGVIPKAVAIDYGLTGPNLRGSGVEYDLRKADPCLVYDRLQFDFPVGSAGDCYDRYLVRMEEMRQSARILHQ